MKYYNATSGTCTAKPFIVNARKIETAQLRYRCRTTTCLTGKAVLSPSLCCWVGQNWTPLEVGRYFSPGKGSSKDQRCKVNASIKTLPAVGQKSQFLVVSVLIVFDLLATKQ